MITSYCPAHMDTGAAPISFTNEAEAQRYIDQEVIDPENWQVQKDVIFESIEERNEYVGYSAEDVIFRQRRLDLFKQSRKEGWNNRQLSKALDGLKEVEAPREFIETDDPEQLIIRGIQPKGAPRTIEEIFGKKDQ